MLESLYESFKVSKLTLEEAQETKRLHAKVKLKDGTIIEGTIENENINGYLVIKSKGSIYQIWEETVGEVDLFDLDKEAENFEGGHQKTIAFDFDGVVAEYKSGQYPEIGEPVDGIRELIDTLKSEGWKVVIWTCRTPAEVDPWLLQHGFEVDEINQNTGAPTQSNKIPADIYVDDRAIAFKGDAKALAAQIADFKLWSDAEEEPPELEGEEPNLDLDTEDSEETEESAEPSNKVIVKEIAEPKTVWVCPNCEEEIQEKSLFCNQDTK